MSSKAAKQGKRYASRAEVRKKTGFLVIIPPGMFEGIDAEIWWHRLKPRAKRRVARLRETVPNVTMEELEP